VERALTGQPLVIYGDGQQSRCFACVDDVVDCVIALMGCPQAAGRVYNVGSTEEITIEALADRIIELTGHRSEKRFVSYEEAYGKPFDDMRRRVPCLDRVHEAVGYTPQTTLQRTLELVIADQQRLLECQHR
jgi:UDP-glucose 4-epimerase